MLSSHFESILLEYKQSITAKKMGKALVGRLNVDVLRFPNLMTPKLEKAFQTMEKIDVEVNDFNNKKEKNEIKPEELTKLEPKIQKAQEQYKILENQIAVHILEKLEAADPTNNKGYVQWLARLYINGETSLEDIESTIADYLDKFHKLKVKRHLSNADIGQYKDFDLFMNDMDQYPNDVLDDDEAKNKTYKADKIYDENGALVIHPKDEEAACRYGRGTRWCTASTRGHNYFASYNRRGPLYIFVPRKPDHPGEKYQFHFEDNVVADETDAYLDQDQLIRLVNRYPALKDAFQPQAEKYGLIYLQKPKRVMKGSNFKVEEYRKNDKPLYLMLGEMDVDGKQDIYMLWKKDPNDDHYQIKKIGNSRYSNDTTLNVLEQHKLFNKYPELINKFGLKTKHLKKDPTRSQTKSGADIEMHGTTAVLKDKQGHSTSIELRDPDDSRNEYDKLLVHTQKTNPFTSRDKKEIRNQINPFEVTLEHPELIDLYSPLLDKKIKHEVRQHNGDAKDKRKFKEDLYQKYAPLMPYKLHDKGDVIIKSHVTPDGKPILDYIITKDNDKETNAITVVYRNQRDGNVDKIIQAEPRPLYDLADEEDYNLRTPAGDIYGNAEEEPKYQRYYQRMGNVLNNRSSNALPFLPSISYIEKYPGLKELYKDTTLASPKTKEVSNANVRDFGKTKRASNKRSYYRNDWHDETAETMRNYIVKPKDAEQGESYAISWSPEIPQLSEIYHSASDGTQTKIGDKQTKRHVLKSFPEIRALQIKDWDKFIKNNPEYDVKEHGAGDSSYNDDILQDWSFSPTEVVDNDRVIVSQFGPKQGDPFQLPSFEVFPKQKNPFGKVGDTFFIYLSLKDYRGKSGKISNIKIQRIGKNTHHFVPVNKYGRTENQGNEDFVQAGVQLRENRYSLDSKEIIDFFKYYPELRGMIKDENVHPKVPHPALVKQPKDSSENVQQMDGFKLEKQTTNNPNLDKYFIVPDEEKYPGEYYTMFEYHPLKTNPLGKSTNALFTDYGRPVAFNERGMIQLGVGEQSKNDSMSDFIDSVRGGAGSITPNTPLYNELMERFPELANYIAEKSKEIGDVRTQNLTEEDIVEVGQNRVYIFKNHDGSDCYYITPIGNEVRRINGQISDRHISSESERSMSQYQRTAHTLNPRKIAGHEEDWEDDDHWNSGESYVINFESTESNPFLQVPLYIDPFRGVAELQVNAIEFDNDNRRYTASEVPQNKQFIIDKLSAVPQPNEENMNTASFTARNYLTRAKQNPELMRWLEQKAEEANAKTNGVGAFINFLPITTEQMTIDVPKVHGVDVVGIAKIGISNPLYLWQGRKEVFQTIEQRLLSGSENYYARQDSDEPDPYTQWANEYANSKNLAPKQEGGSTIGMSRFISEPVAEGVVGVKPESGGKFIDYESQRQSGRGITLTQVPDAKWITTGNQLLNLNKIAKPKELKQMGLSPTQAWGPRQVAQLPNPQITNKGKPWINNIKEFKFPDGLGINASGYGNRMPQKVLGSGTGYLITLNPISDVPYRKRKDGKIVNMLSPWHTATRAVRDLDLPWDFTHGVLDYSRGDFEKKNTMMIYFANNRVAYFLEPTFNGDFRQFNLSQEQKKKLFFDPETGLFPELKPIFDQYAKSNKWLRENKWHHMLSKVLFESLGDKAYWELRKRQEKQNQNFSQLVWLDNVRLTGSYSNDKLKELGFFLKNGKWAIQKPKFDRLIRDGKLKETVLRPLKTGKNKIPKVGKKKVNEGTWAFDEEGILELLKKPLLKGGDNEDVDLSCEVCQGHGCGSGYDIKDDLRRWKDMLNPEADNRPEHLTNEYIQGKIKKLEALVNKFPKGIPDNIDCSAGMSNMKHREWMKNKNPEAEDVLYSVFGDDSLFDDISELDEDDDVRPIIMARLKELDPTLHEKALSIYKDRSHLRVVKEGKKLPRTSEFLHVKELEDIKRLSGVYERYQIPVQVEGATSAYSGSNISKTAAEIAKIMKEKDIQPGTPEWFQLWFALPKLTGEKPTGDIK
jgi:hypothetical protein